MSVALPTVEEVEALYAFIAERAEEEWQAVMDDDALSDEARARSFRVSNSNKLALTGAAAYVVDLLSRGDDPEQAARAWHHLTAAGEEWRGHPDYLTAWENSQRALVRQRLEGRAV